MPRVCIVGLDCVPPVLGFDPSLMPNLCRLGRRGPLQSSIPPITVPAWSVMTSGRDPGELGCYGFRDRVDWSYTGRRLASGADITLPRLWDIAAAHGLRSRLIGVPQTHPPPRIPGAVVSDGPLPPRSWPPEIEAEVEALTGGYIADIEAHRTRDRDELLATIHTMTERRFRLARDWVRRDDWDLFMMVEMGPDRMHHAFWRYHFADHPDHEPGHRFATALSDYYRRLDRELGALVDCLRADDVVLVVSDHGAQTMRGGFALNQWLIERGALVVEWPSTPTPLSQLHVDWSRTRAWAEGGYVGRIYFNLRGREPEGIVGDHERFEAELLDAVAAIGPGSRAHVPRRIYREVRGHPPDLIVEIGGLAYRALGTVGHPTLWPRYNDTGADDANHSYEGIVAMRGGVGELPASLKDVAPIVLERLGCLPRP